MQIKDSLMLTITLNKLLPLIMLFSFYVFSYGGIYPGGGFQSGVIFGTIVICFEYLFETNIKNDLFYSIVELSGVALFFLILVLIFFTAKNLLKWGMIFTDSLIFSNIIVWILNFSIFLEVSGSLILMFRNFLAIGESPL